jgi:hypothetical protein
MTTTTPYRRAIVTYATPSPPADLESGEALAMSERGI